MAEKTEKENRILIAMDGSKYCNYAFDWYLENVKRPSDYVILVHCVEMNSLATMPGDIGASGLLIKSMEQERETCDKYLRELTDKMKAADLHGKVKRTNGPARTEILRVAEDEKVHMIITGSRGMGTIRRTLLGSVSDHVLHHSHVPVIICKHKDHDHQHHHHHQEKQQSSN